jgi:hypothetical protein
MASIAPFRFLSLNTSDAGPLARCTLQPLLDQLSPSGAKDPGKIDPGSAAGDRRPGGKAPWHGPMHPCWLIPPKGPWRVPRLLFRCCSNGSAGVLLRGQVRNEPPTAGGVWVSSFSSGPATMWCRRREMRLVTDHAVVAERPADPRLLAGRLDDGAVAEGLHGCDRTIRRVDDEAVAGQRGCDWTAGRVDNGAGLFNAI